MSPMSRRIIRRLETRWRLCALESVLAVCLGCKVFAVLMRVGLIPESVCEECADLSARLAQPVS